MMTTGFLGVMWALHACQSVSVYGMGGGESEQENGMVQYNYYSWQPRDAHYFMPLHPWDDEAILLMRLEQAGALRRLVEGFVMTWRKPCSVQHWETQLLYTALHSTTWKHTRGYAPATKELQPRTTKIVPARES
eukprot:3932684-Rhodomonas_salina.1